MMQWIISNILKQKYTGNYQIQGHTCTHTHPLSLREREREKVWHCDPTKNKEKVWIVGPPAEKPFPGVPVAELFCGLRQKLEGSLKSSWWLFFSCFCFLLFEHFFPGARNLENENCEYNSYRTFFMFHCHLFLWDGHKPTLLYACIYVVVCACAHTFHHSVKQNSLITLPTIAEQRGLSGEPRPPNCVSHEQSSKIS